MPIIEKIIIGQKHKTENEQIKKKRERKKERKEERKEERKKEKERKSILYFFIPCYFKRGNSLSVPPSI